MSKKYELTNITNKMGTSYWVNQYVLGDFEITEQTEATKTTNLEPEEEIISSLSEIIKYLKKGKPTGKEKEKLEDAKEKAELLISEITKHTQKWRERKTEKEILELSKKNPGLLLGGVQRQ